VPVLSEQWREPCDMFSYADIVEVDHAVDLGDWELVALAQDRGEHELREGDLQGVLVAAGVCAGSSAACGCCFPRAYLLVGGFELGGKLRPCPGFDPGISGADKRVIYAARSAASPSRVTLECLGLAG
jgi:hypothetical protein